MERIKILIRGLITTLVFAFFLFLAAGTAGYLQGWIFLGTSIVTTFMHFLAFPKNTALMEERSSVKKDAKSWDKRLLAVSGIVYLLNIILAGLDAGRFHWSPLMTWPVFAAGATLMILGQAIFLTALRENQYFSSIVRIQKERGHKVCDTGIYRIVRHPGYAGMIIALAGVPLVTGSLWSGITTLIAILLLFVRTALEDRTLMAELDGYKAYAAKTRSRLVPGIW